jgi:deoxyribose-phosphate aldolase
MKILEYGYYDLATNETETKELIKKALSFQPHSVSVLPYYVRTIRPIVFGRTELSCVIDYPFGLTESASRILSIEYQKVLKPPANKIATFNSLIYIYMEIYLNCN